MNDSPAVLTRKQIINRRFPSLVSFYGDDNETAGLILVYRYNDKQARLESKEPIFSIGRAKFARLTEKALIALCELENAVATVKGL